MREGPEENPFAPPAEHADVPLQRVTYENWNLATHGQRLGGAMIDGLLSTATAIPGFMVFMAFMKEGWAGTSPSGQSYENLISNAVQLMGLIFIGPLLLGAYQWYLITKTGQTLAKRWLGMRIVREGSGELPGFVHGVLLRTWLFFFAGLIPYLGGCIGLVDAIAIFFGDRRQTLHDRVAGTIVISGQ